MPALGGLLLVASSALTTRRRWTTLKRRGVNRGLLLLSILMMISCTMAHQPGEAWLGLAHFLPYFWLLATQAELIASPKQLQQTATIVALTVAPIAIIGLGELYLGWSSPPGLAGAIPWPPNPGGTPPGRMASVFGYANNLALYLNMALALLLGLWGSCFRSKRGKSSSNITPTPETVAQPVVLPRVQAVAEPSATQLPNAQSRDADPTAPTTTNPRSSEKETQFIAWLSSWPRSRLLLLWTLLIGLCLIGLILTQSRSAWGLAMLSGLAMAIYWGWTWLGAAVLGFAGSILWAAFGPIGKGPLRQIIPEFFWARLTDQNFSDRPLATLRITQWQFSLDMADARPLTGWGLRNFSHLYQAETATWLGHPHNLFLMLSAETGWFITGGLLGLVGWIFYHGIEVIWAKFHLNTADSYLFFGTLIAFLNTVFFHFFDIPLFDFRINALGWIILSQILGVVYLSDAGNLNLGLTAQLKTD